MRRKILWAGGLKAEDPLGICSSEAVHAQVIHQAVREGERGREREREGERGREREREGERGREREREGERGREREREGEREVASG